VQRRWAGGPAGWKKAAGTCGFAAPIFGRIFASRRLALQIGARQLKTTSFPLRIPLRRAYLEERGKNMKKLLLATSILAGTAGLAAAEVTLSGDARMGFLDEFVYADGADDDLGFTSRARVAFNLSGETDGGLSFGASFRADNSNGAAGGTAGSVFLSGAFGKISMGDVDGAALAAVGHVDGVGLTGLGDLNESAFIGNGGLRDDDLTDIDTLDTALGGGNNNFGFTGDPSVLYEYTTGNVGLFVGVTNPGFEAGFDTDVPADGTNDVFTDGTSWTLGANYTTDAYKFGIGYEDLDVDFNDAAGVGLANISADHLYLGADATFGGFTGKVRWGQASIDTTDAAGAAVVAADIPTDFDQWSLSGTYAMDAISVTGFLANKQFENSTGANVLERDSIGLGASYDLGGGAKVVGGIVDDEITNGAGASVSDTSFDFGVSFSF
jgi:outer membrane protein OmpU